VQHSEPKQADLIVQLAKHEIEIFPDSQFGGKEVSAFGEGVNQCCSLIGQLNGITTLDLANTDVDDRGFAQLCKLTTLRCLRLTSNHVTEKGLLHASAFEHLVELHVQKFPVKGLLEVFCHHPNLEVISAIGCNLNEDDMIHLSNVRIFANSCLTKIPFALDFDMQLHANNLR